MNFKKINGGDSHLRDADGGADVYTELRLKIKMNELLTLSDSFWHFLNIAKSHHSNASNLSSRNLQERNELDLALRNGNSNFYMFTYERVKLGCVLSQIVLMS